MKPTDEVVQYLKEHGPRQRPHKYVTMMNIASEYEKQSSCLRNQFGAIITTHDFSMILSVGYNGSYKGGPNHCHSLEQGKCMCIHAEANCLIKYPFGMYDNVIMFVTGNPCISCASMIINADIKHVVYDREYKSDNFAGLNLIKSVGIKVERLSDAIA